MTIEVRSAQTHEELRALERLFAGIWGFSDDQVIPALLFVAARLAGHQLLVAYDGATLVGGSWAFLTYDGATIAAHSHITGVLPSYEGTGLGFRLKQAQRAWCIERGITGVTWTFDPMVARNAAFNLRKLGATGVRFLANHYGDMRDRFNAGDATDRIEVVWDLEAPPRAPQAPRSAILVDVGGVPGRVPPGEEPVAVAVPRSYHELRAADPQRAAFWRDAVRGSMSHLFGRGYRATGFDPDAGYLFTRP